MGLENLEINEKLKFVAYYMKCGDIQGVANKSGLITNEAKITNIKNVIFLKGK